MVFTAALLYGLCPPVLVAASLTLVDVLHETQFSIQSPWKSAADSKANRVSPSGKQMGEQSLLLPRAFREQLVYYTVRSDFLSFLE